MKRLHRRPEVVDGPEVLPRRGQELRKEVHVHVHGSSASSSWSMDSVAEMVRHARRYARLLGHNAVVLRDPCPVGVAAAALALCDRRSTASMACHAHATAYAGHGDGFHGTAAAVTAPVPLGLYLGPPEVLDLVVRPAREVLGDPRPPCVGKSAIG
jgi:hypothetical protein